MKAKIITCEMCVKVKNYYVQNMRKSKNHYVQDVRKKQKRG